MYQIHTLVFACNYVHTHGKLALSVLSFALLSDLFEALSNKGVGEMMLYLHISVLWTLNHNDDQVQEIQYIKTLMVENLSRFGGAQLNCQSFIYQQFYPTYKAANLQMFLNQACAGRIKKFYSIYSSYMYSQFS